MSLIHFAKAELSVAIARGVRQCVLIGSRPGEAFKSSPDQTLQVFSVDEEQSSEALAAALLSMRGLD